MFVKTLILGLISAGATGAVVYYGTSPEGLELLESGKASLSKEAPSPAETRTDLDDGRITPRLPTVRKGDKTPDTREKLASGEWLDLEDLQAEAKTAAEAERPTPESAKAEPKKQTRWLDQYLKNNKTEELEVELYEDEAELENKVRSRIPAKVAADSATARYTVREREIIEDIEPEIMPEDASVETSSDMPPPEKEAAETDGEGPKYFRIVDGKLVEVTPDEAAEVAEKAIDDDIAQMDKDMAQMEKDMAEMEEAIKASEEADRHMAEIEAMEAEVAATTDVPKHKFTGDINTLASDSTPILATVMKEAAEIKKPELRDQAYFEITEYALSEGRYDSARMAHDMIEQNELAYTAKSRIAVAYAQNGKPTQAFKTISEVDEPELRDFMRLQVIEALIAPQKLPEGWQEKRN